MLQLREQKVAGGENGSHACRALAIPREAHTHTHTHTGTMSPNALYDENNTTDVSRALMIAASGHFQAEKQMLPGSLNPEGHVMHHSPPSPPSPPPPPPLLFCL